MSTLTAGELDVFGANLALDHAVRPVLQRLSDVAIRPVALKGYALLQGRPALWSQRPMSDVDLLVSARQLETVLTTVEECGFQRLRSGGLDFERRHGRLSHRIDVHTGLWHLGESGLMDFLNRSELTDDGNLTVPGREDHLIHIAAHGVVTHGQLRRAWQRDVRVLVDEGIHWPLLTQLAGDVGLSLPLQLLLDRSSVDVPATAAAELRSASGPRWRRALLESALDRPENPGLGHLLRPLFGGGWRKLAQQLFRDRSFRVARYQENTGPLLRAARVSANAARTAWRYACATGAPRRWERP